MLDRSSIGIPRLSLSRNYGAIPIPSPDPEPGAVFFRIYQDQTLRRMYELGSTNQNFQPVPLSVGSYPMDLAHRVRGQRY